MLDLLGVGVMLATVVTILIQRDTFNYGNSAETFLNAD